MHEWESQSHVKWECKYHVVIVPKYRRRVLYGKLKKAIGQILRDLCKQKGVTLVEGHLMPDHVHMCLSIPPKFSVAFVIGFLKGKTYGMHFWSVGYCVSTVGLDEKQVRQYIRDQEKLESSQGELKFE